jgi:hypothetical protein
MKMKRMRWLAVAVIVGVGLGFLIMALPGGQAQARDSRDASFPQGGFNPSVTDKASVFAAGPAMAGDVLSLAGSSVATDDCYQEDKAQTLCFTVYNGSTDGEWVNQVRLTFPTLDGNWQAACNSALEDQTDSVGYPVDLNCSTPSVNEILYTDNAGGWDGISAGASWHTCVDVTIPSGYNGIRPIPWVLDGSDSGSENDQVWIEKCTPLTLKPSQAVIAGCNGAVQSLDFELTNYGAGNGVDVTLVYDAPDATFTGLTDVTMNEGETITFTAGLKPDLCLEPGEQVVANLTVNGNGHEDTSVITQTISDSGGWRRRSDSPISSMDNVVIWAHREDGPPGDEGLWSIGGLDSGGAAQRYDPGADTWITYTNPLSPVIEYPMDGCYGLNDQGEEIVTLFPDTVVTGSLQVFNLEHHTWSTRSIPIGYPEEGRWAHDVVSLLQHTGENVCYLSGGSTETGGGRTRDLWEYDPGANTVVSRGPFTATVWFGFHASWYVPWIGDDGGICVAGGVDHNYQVNNATQCYDIGADTFNPQNSDLGTLPEPWWGMADGWQITDQGYELWIAGGVAQDGTLLPASAYFREGMTGFAYGPPVSEPLYRLEGDSYAGQFFTLNGSRGGFWSSPFSLHLASCPTCNEIFLPLTIRDN